MKQDKFLEEVMKECKRYMGGYVPSTARKINSAIEEGFKEAIQLTKKSCYEKVIEIINEWSSKEDFPNIPELQQKIKEELKKEIEEELRKGIGRNKVLPLDWAMDRINPILERYFQKAKEHSKKKIEEFVEKLKEYLDYRESLGIQRYTTEGIKAEIDKIKKEVFEDKKQ